MSIYDSKQDVIDIKLTPHGKYLLSNGLFKPQFYAFFDDDIIYDINYARKNSSELQNETQTRLLENSLFIDLNTNLSSKDKTVNMLNKHKTGFGDYTFDSQDNIRAIPLGTSDYNKTYAPAWDIKCLKGVFSSFVSNTNNSNITNPVNIPQINLTDTLYDIEIVKSDNIFLDSQSANSVILEDGSKINVMEDYILLEINEKNAEDTSENFEIELYLTDGNTYSTPGYMQKLIFSSKQEKIIDNILIDDNEILNLDENIDLDPRFAQHFFDILVDEEIEIVTGVSSPQTINEKLTGTYRATNFDINDPDGEKC